MSLFMNTFGAAQEVSQEKLDVASVQFDAMNKTFNTILDTCLEKCIGHEGYGESGLNKGELCCIDRCVAKLHYGNRLIGGMLQSRGFNPTTYLPHYEQIRSQLAVGGDGTTTK